MKEIFRQHSNDLAIFGQANFPWFLCEVGKSYSSSLGLTFSSNKLFLESKMQEITEFWGGWVLGVEPKALHMLSHGPELEFYPGPELESSYCRSRNIGEN